MQNDWYPYEKKRLRHTCTQRDDHMKTWGMTTNHKPSREASKETNTVSTLTLNFCLRNCEIVSVVGSLKLIQL